MSRSDAAAAGIAHDRALADWIEAEALVVSLRRSAAFAAQRAAERSRAAALLVHTGRADAFALGVADAARVLAQRAEAEARRLEEAVRAEERLRARAAAARLAIGAGSLGEAERDRRGP